MAFVNDTFTDAAGTLLVNHLGETGADWTLHPSYANDAVISNANRCRPGAGTTAAYASGAPASAEYDVECDVEFLTDNNAANGPCGRMSTSADTHYHVRYSRNGLDAQWELYKFVDGAATLLGTFTDLLIAGMPRRVKLEIRDAAKKVYIDGVERISSTDNAITDVGRAGLRLFRGDTNTTGIHLDNFTATDAAGGGEAFSGAAQTTGAGSSQAAGEKGAAATAATAADGDTQASGQKATSGTAATTAAGSTQQSGQKGGRGSLSTSAAGQTDTVGAKHADGATSTTGGGTSTVQGTPTGAQPTGQANTSGNGASSVSGFKGSRAIAQSSVGGTTATAGSKAVANSTSTSGSGATDTTGLKASSGAVTTSGGGTSTASGEIPIPVTPGVIVLSAGEAGGVTLAAQRSGGLSIDSPRTTRIEVSDG